MSVRFPGRSKNEGPWAPCKVEECKATVEGGAKGFCHAHYVAARRGTFDWATGARLREPLRVVSYGEGARCSVSGCGRRPKGDGLCPPHWLRRKKGQELGSPLLPRKLGVFTVCLMPDCTTRATSRGMCNAHASRRNAGLIDAEGNKLRDRSKGGPVRGPSRMEQGYVVIRAPLNHPRARHDGSMAEHRLVMEQAIGRYLEEWELVHHKDGDRANNLLSNLELLDGRARNGTKSHPPGSEYDLGTSVQVVLQQDNLPPALRTLLLEYQLSIRNPLG